MLLRGWSVCEWSKCRNWRRRSALQLHPAGSPHLNHIRLMLCLLISEPFHSASVWFTCSWKSCLNFSCMVLLLLLSSPLDLSELKDSVHSKCNKIVPFKGRDLNWGARDHERTDPLNVFTVDVKDYIMRCGIVFLSMSRLSVMTMTTTAHTILLDYLRPRWRGSKKHHDRRRWGSPGLSDHLFWSGSFCMKQAEFKHVYPSFFLLSGRVWVYQQ